MPFSAQLVRSRDRVLVSYSHLDVEWLNRLRQVLAPDQRNARIDYWDDRDVAPGDPWYDRILDGIARARVAILLVSPNFLASRFIMQEELPRILHAAEDGLTVLWVPLSGTFYGSGAMEGIGILNSRQAVFDPGQPLDQLPLEGQTEKLLELCRRITKLLNPGRVPKNLPFPTLGNLFKGREAELAKLNAQLRQHGSSAIVQPQAVNGLGGIGKTRLALEYAWRHENEFTALLFVSANTPEDLATNLARLSASDGALDLPEYKFAKQDEQYEAVIRWLQQNQGWLLILDNVDTREAVAAVQKLVAKFTGGQILITSRYTSWGEGIVRLPLDVISSADAVALLLERAHALRAPRPEDEREAKVLAERLGRLPLALTHAAAYAGEYELGFSAYLAEFDRALGFFDHDLIRYEADPDKARPVKTVATTFFMSFDRLGPLEKAILRATSFLAPESIPTAMFEDSQDEVNSLVALWSEEKGEPPLKTPVREALAQLARFSLLTRGNGVFNVHRMEQLVLRSSIPEDRVPKWIEATRAILVHYTPEETAESPRTWSLWDNLRPHAEAVVAAVRNDARVAPHADFLSSLGNLYFGKGLYGRSLRIEEWALRDAERASGAESAAVADKLLGYGESLRALGQQAEAEAAFRKTLAMREKLDGVDHPRVADALNYLALALSDGDTSEEAEGYYRRALRIYEAQGSAVDKTDYGKVLLNLGSLAAEKGNTAEAEELLEKAVALTADKSDIKIKPQSAVNCRCQLGDLKASKGEPAIAERLYREGLDWANAFPPRHFVREIAIDRLITFLRNERRLAEAKRVLSETRGPSETVDGETNEERPEIHLAAKLRICEAHLHIDGTNAEEQNGAALLSEMELAQTSDWQPWHPPILWGMTIVNSKSLNPTFTVNSGSESVDSKDMRPRFQRMAQHVLTAVAVPESEQWATSEGEMPARMRGTGLGRDLAEQAARLKSALRMAVDKGGVAGEAFRRQLAEKTGLARDKWLPVSLEVWLAPEKARVYAGDFTGKLQRYKVPGEVQMAVTSVSLKLVWECRPGNAQAREFARAFDAAFAEHLLPVITRMVTEGRALSGLRQVGYAMAIALWFKSKFSHHANLSKYVETGNTGQLQFTLSSIRRGSDQGAEPVDGSDDKDSARLLDIRQKAFECYQKAQYEEAYELLQRLLREEFDVAGTHCHMARIRLMTDRYAEAREHAAKASARASEPETEPYLLARIQFFELLFALLDGSAIAAAVGKLKRTINDGDVQKEWTIAPMLDHLAQRLGSRNETFLRAVAAALNDTGKVAALDALDDWRSTPEC